MARTLALLALLVSAGGARADGGFIPLPLRQVPVHLSVAVASAPDGAATFVYDRLNGVRRVPVGDSLEIAYPVGERFCSFTVFAVRVADVSSVPGGEPDENWLREHALGAFTEYNYNRGRLDSFDGRNTVIVNYRVEVHGERIKLVRASSNDPLVSSTTVFCAAGLAMPIGLVWFGVWLARRMNRRTGFGPSNPTG